MKKTTFIIIALIFLIAGAFLWQWSQKKSGGTESQVTTPQDEGVMCAQDVRQCRNGSYVHRVAPSCEFAKCPDGTAAVENPVFEDGTVPQ